MDELDELLALRVGKDHKIKLAQIAKEEDRSMSAVARRLIDAEYDRLFKAKEPTYSQPVPPQAA